MSYYDDPLTYIHAKIASENSEIVNLRYSYNKVISTIASTPLEELSEDVIQQQLQIVKDLQKRKLNISMLQSELTAFTPQPITAPVDSVPVDSAPVDSAPVDPQPTYTDLSGYQ